MAKNDADANLYYFLRIVCADLAITNRTLSFHAASQTHGSLPPFQILDQEGDEDYPIPTFPLPADDGSYP